jgi:hypothetical protein
VVPTVCSNGTYCPQGSSSQTVCPPGSYCPARSGSPTLCPGGFYCPGGGEYYYACTNGTFCPPGSSSPLSCPEGTFGTGTANNVDVTTACSACGRGQYSSVDTPGYCFDCPPGYVCLGSTKTATPSNASADNGYVCPAGFFCPTGSYVATACPLATYNPNAGKGLLSDCLACKEGFYSSAIGQSGCKKCGPSSASPVGSTTCTCLGANRVFIKSNGNCLCEAGYKAKDGESDADSASDCEQVVQTQCQFGQAVDVQGNCVANETAACSN